MMPKALFYLAHCLISPMPPASLFCCDLPLWRANFLSHAPMQVPKLNNAQCVCFGRVMWPQHHRDDYVWRPIEAVDKTKCERDYNQN